jgi:diadenosine tetraphosphatase ApaH/serine/threonine PP2A family protein phosphatase
VNGKSDLEELIKNPLDISKLNHETVISILDEGKKALSNDLLLIEFPNQVLDNEIYIIGDIHGNLKSLTELIQLFKVKNPNLVIFLGDLVDRGPYQLECLLTVLILKILEPKRYYILKGNHESEEINKYYGFYEDFTQKLGHKVQFNSINDIYALLPYCALINDDVLCLHGGIPEDIDILKRIKGKKVEDLYLISQRIRTSLLQVLWNDPKEGVNGFSESYRGPGIKFFGEDAFNGFMEYNRLSYLIRAHEMFQEGYKWFFNKHLLSIFSSENYRGEYYPNPASYAVIKENQIYARLL